MGMGLECGMRDLDFCDFYEERLRCRRGWYVWAMVMIRAFVQSIF